MRYLIVLLFLASPVQAQLKNPPVESWPSNPPVTLTYSQACAEAIAKNRYMQVFVGLPVVEIADVVSCGVLSLEGYPSKCVVVARPRNGVMEWVSTADANGTPIREVVQPVVAADFRPVFSYQSANCGPRG